jgi:hypothetical protein
MESLPNFALQLIDTFLSSEDKISLKSTSTTMYRGLRIQPFSAYQSHFLSRRRYNALFKTIEDQSLLDVFHGGQLRLLFKGQTKTILNVSNHCCACLHRIPSNSLTIPSIYSLYKEPDLAYDPGHKCCFEEGKVRRCPSKSKPPTSKDPRNCIYVVEMYHFTLVDDTPLWTKKVVYACDEACVIDMEESIESSMCPYFMVSYSVEGIRTLGFENEQKQKLHLFMMKTRIHVSAAIHFNLEMTQDGMLRSVFFNEVFVAPLEEAITLCAYLPVILSGKEEQCKRNAALLAREFHYWTDWIHPHPPMDTEHELNIVEVSSFGLIMKTLKFLNSQQPSMYVYAFNNTLDNINRAVSELSFKPFKITLQNAGFVDDDGNLEPITYNFKIAYRYSKILSKWGTFIKIDDSRYMLTYSEWIDVCQATAMNFNFAKAFQVRGQDAVDNETYVHTVSILRSMRVRLFLGDDGGLISTDPDHDYGDVLTQSDIEAQESLSEFEEDELMSDSD